VSTPFNISTFSHVNSCSYQIVIIPSSTTDHGRATSTSHGSERPMSTREHKHVQATAYIKRKPGLTQAQFYDYWQNVHARKVAPWAEKHGVLSYKQVNMLISSFQVYIVSPNDATREEFYESETHHSCLLYIFRSIALAPFFQPKPPLTVNQTGTPRKSLWNMMGCWWLCGR